MASNLVVMVAALAVSGAWGGLLAHYGKALAQRWRERPGNDTRGGGAARRDLVPARIAIPVAAPRRKRERK